MAKQKLTDTTLRNTKPEAKDKRLTDGDGLYLLVKSNGAKWWRFDYSFQGKRKTISLGVYPTIGLADARRKADEARTNVANDIDPSDTRKAIKAAQQLVAENEKRLDAGLPIINSFEHVAREWEL
ncbi:Arm DNA-binding domain-containing protein [Methylobacter sp.]|uniref:Arm DNA-binding domain-containing protein n=1 Tax=Methylobacter sp. TaxID=2051955 RepID=UPI003DA603E7